MTWPSFKFFTYTKQTYIHIALAILISNSWLSPTLASPDQTTLDVIAKAQENIFDKQINNEHWNMPNYLGTIYAAEFYLYSKYKNQPNLFSQAQVEILKTKILAEQRNDGSWAPLIDANRVTGDLAATIIQYWTLKTLGVPIDSKLMVNARHFVLAKGGVSESSLFTKIFLSLFQAYPWARLPLVPTLVFHKIPFTSGVNENQFAQWVRPHILPISYLRKFQVSKDLGAQYKIWELYIKPPINEVQPPQNMRNTHTHLLKLMMKRQATNGSWGGYTSATMLTNIALGHALQTYKANMLAESKIKITANIKAGDSFLMGQTQLNGESVLSGWTCDGRYWDTALLSSALMESGISVEKLKKPFQFLKDSQSDNGGFPFGLGFEKFPDLDDTAEIILALSHTDWNPARALEWIEYMQNFDGGWAAFDKNNYGNLLIKEFAAPFIDSADLFDESSADVTGHVLEALGAVGYNLTNSYAVQDAVDYLRLEWLLNGPWRGRWGVNYIYGTGAALVGLLKVGVPKSDPMIKATLAWLKEAQNPDGGFGESYLSDTIYIWKAKGVSTPSQTAWALLPMIAAGDLEDPTLLRGIAYLQSSFKNNGNQWVDSGVVGTGHPGVVYMIYPSYPYAFPLIALGRYAKALKN